MNNNIAIKVEHLSKRYRIGQYVGSGAQYKTLRESLTNAVSAPLRRLRQTGDGRPKTDPPSPVPGPRSSSPGQPSTDGYIWALRDVSFEVKQGEVLGIIGRNGAGKSTLLKILTRITEPSEGRAVLNGRVNSLLEVGTGFHPELTGRENVRLSGAILGMTRKEIDRKFDEIVDFSGVETFIDTPVKRFSSGMRVRLGFAVAAHLEPEILLIDEVLAVGDAAFQKKCLGKMGDVAKEGRTVLFVSHNMGAISRLCRTALLLQDGRIVKDGPAQEVVVDYLASGSMQSSGDLDVSDPSWRIRSYSLADSRFKWTRITLLNSRSQVSPDVLFGEPFEVVLQGIAAEPVTGFRGTLGIHTVMGVVVFNSWYSDHGLPTSFPAGEIRFRVKVEPNYLAPGTYEIYIGADVSHVEDTVGPFRFDVQAAPFSAQHVWKSNHRGVVANPCTWSLDGVSREDSS